MEKESWRTCLARMFEFKFQGLLGKEMKLMESCQTCTTSERKGWVWMPSKMQWVECWGCNNGVDPAKNITTSSSLPPIVSVMSKTNLIQLPPASAKTDLVPKIIDVGVYTNPHRKPYMKHKSEKSYVCVKCGTRAYNPTAVCQESACVGSVVKQELMHIRVIPHGKMHDILVFMHLLHAGDPEWVNPKTCDHCDSVIIKCPTLGRNQMFKLAKQCGLKKLKIKRWLHEDECKKKFPEVAPVL